jgi:hypothetical protein
VQSSRPGVRVERALIWTTYFRDRRHRAEPAPVQAAEALAKVLREKSVRIHPDELIVGNFSSKRVAGAIYPELHGVAMMAVLGTIADRAVNPLEITPAEIAALRKIRLFWRRRSIPYRTYSSAWRKVRLVADQLSSRY